MEPYTKTCYYLSMMQSISKMFGTAVSCDFQIKKFHNFVGDILTCGENGETKP